MESPEPQPSASLRDVIVTLPKRTYFLLMAGSVLLILIALGVTAHAQSDELKSAAAHAVVVMLPLMIALIAAGGIRRTSTHEIDLLVDGFLQKTVYERFRLWCDTGDAAHPPYPFESVDKPEPPNGRSYADFRFHWRGSQRRAPAEVAVKTNVLNFEVVTTIALCCPNGLIKDSDLGNRTVDRSTLKEATAHPLLNAIFSTIQGSVEEGYAIRVTFSAPQVSDATTRLSMTVSLRQKPGVNFLTSPFLKRYFAEDAAIVVGVLYRELLASELLADDHA